MKKITKYIRDYGQQFAFIALMFIIGMAIVVGASVMVGLLLYIENL